MSFKIFAVSAAVLALSGMAPVWAANPASGEVSEETRTLEWAGSGPYVFPNVSGSGADPVCEPAIPQVCDVFTLTVNISDEFRELEENQRESVRIAIAFPATTGTEDLDFYLYNEAGNEIGSGTGSFGVQEAITVPLKTLKNGTYTAVMVPFTPMGANYTGAVQVGKDAAATKADSLALAPRVGSAPLAVQFDARGLSAGSPSSYVFDFGDGTAPVADTDGVVEHIYLSSGEFLARVQASNAARGVAGASAIVLVEPLADIKAGGSRMGGAFGLGSLLVLAGFGWAARRQR